MCVCVCVYIIHIPGFEEAEERHAIGRSKPLVRSPWCMRGRCCCAVLLLSSRRMSSIIINSFCIRPDAWVVGAAGYSDIPGAFILMYAWPVLLHSAGAFILMHAWPVLLHNAPPSTRDAIIELPCTPQHQHVTVQLTLGECCISHWLCALIASSAISVAFTASRIM